MKKAALVNYCNDYDMLKLQYESGQFDYYDRVYIFDGPYSYVEDSSIYEDYHLSFVDTELGKEILRNNKYVYSYARYEDERNKRIEAYKSIEEDVIFLHDSDEFFHYDLESVENFLHSEKSIGYFRCQNLCLDGVGFSTNSKSSELNVPLAAFAFKKSLVTAENHIDYRWLIGVKQSPQNPNFKYPIALAHTYHFTEMRSRLGQRQKYLFYTLLRNQTHPNPDISRFLQCLDRYVLDETLSKEEACNLYLNTIASYYLAPNLYANKFFLHKRLKYSETLEEICRVVISQRNIFLPGNYKIFNGRSFYFYVYAGARVISVTAASDEIISLKVYAFCFGMVPVLVFDKRFVKSYRLNMEELNTDNLHGYLVEITFWNNESPLLDVNIFME